MWIDRTDNKCRNRTNNKCRKGKEKEMGISRKVKVGYGVGAVGKDMAYALISGFLMYYYNTVLGVSATFIGVLFMGAYREKGFIPYDYDIDLGMYSEDYTPELERELFDAGFSIKRMFYKVENLHPSTKCLTEISLDYKGLQIDVFFYWKENENRIGYVYTGVLGDSYAKKNIYAVRTSLLPVANIDEVDFLGIKFGMPSNTKDCLKKLYGDTFMTPLKNSSYTQSKECIPYTKLYGEMYGAW